MSMIDATLLAGLLAVAAWRLIAPRRGAPARAAACLGLVLLAGVQYARNGFTWQFLTGYLLLAATALPVRGPDRRMRILGGVGLAVLILAAAAPWALLPAPRLPKPTGPYAVGTETFRWIDASRAEAATGDPSDRRNVVLQAWYPARPAAPGVRPAYMDGLGRLPGPLMGLPRFLFRRFGETDSHATAGAAVAADRRWPAVIFSPGYGAPRAVYTGLVADLASRGYIVLAVDHPYEVAVTQLADGRVVGPARDDGRTEAERVAHMERQILVRAADVRFVLDQVSRADAMGSRLSGRLDPQRIAAIGHSFGGATAVLAAGQDARIRAAADIDGMLYGDVAAEAFRGPLLLLESDHGETGHSEAYLAITQGVLSRVPARSRRYEIGGANHFSFTDAPLFLSPPGQWALARVMGGGRGAAATQRAAVDIVDAFLRGPLTGRPASIEAVVARHRDIEGGAGR